MNINPVCNENKCTYQKNSFKARKPEIKIINQVDDYVQEILNKYNAPLENHAKMYGKDIKIAQKENSVFINSGVITSSINLRKMSHARDFYRGIVDNLRVNSEIEKNGLKKSLEKLI